MDADRPKLAKPKTLTPIGAPLAAAAAPKVDSGRGPSRLPSPPAVDRNAGVPPDMQGYQPPADSAQAKAIAAALAARAIPTKQVLKSDSPRRQPNPPPAAAAATAVSPTAGDAAVATLKPKSSRKKTKTNVTKVEVAPTTQAGNFTTAPTAPNGAGRSYYAGSDGPVKTSPSPPPNSSPRVTSAVDSSKPLHNGAPSSSAPADTVVIIHPDPAQHATVTTVTGEMAYQDYSISFFPRMNSAAHLENYFILETLVHLSCGCMQLKRNRQLLLLKMAAFVNYVSPILGALWCLSMVLSLWFFTDALPTQYMYWLLFAGIYPIIRVGFASIPLLKLLLSSFETWFLLAQVALLIASFGALVGWDTKFYFALLCLAPGLVQMILLDANMTSIAYSTFAMLFGAAYMFVFSVLLGTGRIVAQDQTLTFEYFNVSLIDFTNTRLLTLVLFMLKNITALLLNPKSYIQIRSRVYKVLPPPRLENRVSIA